MAIADILYFWSGQSLCVTIVLLLMLTSVVIMMFVEPAVATIFRLWDGLH